MIPTNTLEFSAFIRVASSSEIPHLLPRFLRVTILRVLLIQNQRPSSPRTSSSTSHSTARGSESRAHLAVSADFFAVLRMNILRTMILRVLVLHRVHPVGFQGHEVDTGGGADAAVV